MTDNDATRPSRIYVIDDEFLHASLAQMTLAEAGWEVAGFSCDCQVGIAMAIEHNAGIVLLDIRFGPHHRMGFDVAKKLRFSAARNNIPPPFIVFVTGHGDDETRAIAEGIGGSMYLEKPFSTETLIRSIDEAELLFEFWRKRQG